MRRVSRERDGVKGEKPINPQRIIMEHTFWKEALNWCIMESASRNRLSSHLSVSFRATGDLGSSNTGKSLTKRKKFSVGGIGRGHLIKRTVLFST